MIIAYVSTVTNMATSESFMLSIYLRLGGGGGEIGHIYYS
jgi:hypothetical protein